MKSRIPYSEKLLLSRYPQAIEIKYNNASLVPAANNQIEAVPVNHGSVMPVKPKSFPILPYLVASVLGIAIVLIAITHYQRSERKK